MLRLFRTTAFRFTIIFVFLFVMAVSLIGGVLYRATFVAAERQTDDTINTEIAVLAELFVTSGPGMLTRVIRQRTAWRDDSIYMLIGAPSGAVLAGNLTALPPEALTAEGDFFDFEFERALVDAAGREAGVEQRNARGKVVRLRAGQESQQSFLLVVARDIATRESLKERLASMIIRVVAATVALGVLVGILFSRSVLYRVETVNKTARAVRAGDLTRRIPQSGAGDELDHLGANLNAMLDQIERLMSGMREVSDNIAHDLRSPLTRIRNRLTDALESTDADKEKALQATLDDTERMLKTFNALLSIARIQSGEGARVMGSIDLTDIARELVELYEPAAQEAGFALRSRLQPAPAVHGSRELVSQAIANFLDNALKYAKGGKLIEIEVGPLQGGGAMVAVADDGPGVAVKDRAHILERFVRLEESRTTPGSGLGLSLVSAVARAHNADIQLGEGLPNSEGGAGLRAALHFPRADDSA